MRERIPTMDLTPEQLKQIEKKLDEKLDYWRTNHQECATAVYVALCEIRDLLNLLRSK
jgi:hypothetical protein